MDNPKEFQRIFEGVISKREFSQLPKKDVEIAISHFIKRQVGEEEKIRLVRELLHKVFSSFLSGKLLSPKNKSEEWILRKHLSTRERLPYMKEVYSRIFSFLEKKSNKKVNVIDLGCGINGFSVKIIKEVSFLNKYYGIESVGQLVESTNKYFKENKINGEVLHESLFNLAKIESLLDKIEKPRVIFLFKVIDPLETLENNYSKKLISSLIERAEIIVISFATESMIRRVRFNRKGDWLISFLEKNYSILDSFERGGEKYICFTKK